MNGPAAGGAGRAQRRRAVAGPLRPRVLRILVVAAFVSLHATVRAEAQVGTLATAAPVLSPVGLWRTAANEAGAGALANTLTIRVNSGAIQTIPALLDNVLNAFPSPVNITTEWNLSTLIARVDLVGYFAAPTAALAGAGASIPSRRVEGRMTSGRATTFTPFAGDAVGGVGTPGGTLHLFRQPIGSPLNAIGQRTDNLDLRLDLRGLPKLPSGVYTGTLTLRAIAY